MPKYGYYKSLIKRELYTNILTYSTDKEEEYKEEIEKSNNDKIQLPNNELGKQITGFTKYCRKIGLYYEEDLIRRFIISLKTKRFLILTGISGSGKTKITEAWIKFNKLTKEQYVIKAIGSNWNDNKKLLGYKNILENDTSKQFQTTDIVELLKIANNNQSQEFIILLDEMNLSYVERYFSDFLSALETYDSTINLADGSELTWSNNIKIIGTINVDETTYMFSPKVLDRANIIEFKGSLPSRYIAQMIKANNSSKEAYKKLALYENIIEDYKKIMDDLYLAINKGFAYRTIDEITDYIVNNLELIPESNWSKYLDEQILQKLLPKIYGNSGAVTEILDNLETILSAQDLDDSLSINKIHDMLSKSSSGYISFM